jgi:hypothetical protein
MAGVLSFDEKLKANQCHDTRRRNHFRERKSHSANSRANIALFGVAFKQLFTGSKQPIVQRPFEIQLMHIVFHAYSDHMIASRSRETTKYLREVIHCSVLLDCINVERKYQWTIRDMNHLSLFQMLCLHFAT